MGLYFIFKKSYSTRSIHKLKDKDPPAAQCGDPLVKRVQKEK